MQTRLFSARSSILDRFDRLKEKFVYALIDGIYVLDGDTILTIRDVGDNRFSVAAIRIKGVDAPEIRSKNELEQKAGRLVAQVTRQWCYSSMQNGNELEVIEYPGGKYHGTAMGDLVNSEGDLLSEFLLVNRMVSPYSGGTKWVWTATQLRRVISEAKSLLDALGDDEPDRAWVMPAITSFLAAEGKR